MALQILPHATSRARVAALFPVSKKGWNLGKSWNGKNPGYGIGLWDENEMLVKMGYNMRLVGFKRLTNDRAAKFRLFVQLLDRK